MKHTLSHIRLSEWAARRESLLKEGFREPSYGGPISRHVRDGDLRLRNLAFDPSGASLNLWNFLLTEEDRLAQARKRGRKIVGAMKDLGTIPVMAYALPNVTAFYPDGAWWTPCIMEMSEGLLGVADSLGVDESLCPVRAMLGAFVARNRFPIPDLLTCSVGATCDDFSAIAQRLEGLGHPIAWWEIPHRRCPSPSEDAVTLPGGVECPAALAVLVEKELRRIGSLLEDLSGFKLTDARLRRGIKAANAVRGRLAELRQRVFTAERSPMPALEMLVAEMLAIHFCSDREECLRILTGLVAETKRRVVSGYGFSGRDSVRVFWVNPVADLRAMNILEECGGRICGTDYMFSHALDPIPEDIPPMRALARMALADPMVGPASDRADRVCRDGAAYGVEAVVVSRIPGASHCALEGGAIADAVATRLRVPTVEIEVPPLSDPLMPALRTRLQALIETARERRRRRR